MILIALLLAQAAVAAPTAEAEALGLRLARTGTMATILPALGAKDSAELVAAHPELSPEDQARLRAVAARTLAAGIARIDAAFARAYAERLSLADLRVLVAQAEHPATRRMRAALPQVMAAAMGSVGTLDFKRDTIAAFCRETGKACPAPPGK